DFKRLLQVLKNLLSNAFKFTSQGRVALRVGVAKGGWSADRTALNNAPLAVSFEVTDTGIGIPADKQKIIFEAFQQADAGTSRRYGGTGLGLAISRELASLLGGEIRLVSQPGQGSPFHADPAAEFPGHRRDAGIPGDRERPPRRQPAERDGGTAGRNPRRPREDRTGRSVHLDRGRRPALRKGLVGPGARQGIQSACRSARQCRPVAGPRISADRDHARRLPPRHARL